MRGLLVALVLVGQVFAAPGPARAEDLGVAITSPLEGTLVEGVVALAAETVGAAVAVTFDVSSDASSWTVVGTDTTPADGWTGSWDSTGWSGTAWIRASATDGQTTVAAQIQVTVVDHPAVSIELTNTAFSPNGDGRAERTGIRIALEEPAEITLRITSSDHVVARLLDGSPFVSGTTKVLWDGRRASGRVVRDGRYVVHVEAVDAEGNVGLAEASVVVDTRAPTFAWERVAPDPYRGVGDVRFVFRVHDRAPTIIVRGRVSDVEDRVVASLPSRHVTGGVRRIVWDGSGRGERTPTPGLSHVEITVRDDAGNVATTAPRAFRDHRPTLAHVVRRVDGAGPRVALTFDDCYNAAAWAAILDVLEARHAGGSFFCLGATARMYPALAARTVSEGHTIGGHGWDHHSMRSLDAGEIASRLRREADVWWEVAGATTVPYLRPPGGVLDPQAIRTIGDEGFATIVLWDVDPWDWKNPGPGAVTSRVLTHVRAGSIVVLHAISDTASALPAIIDGLRARGLEPVTLQELLAT